MSVNRLYFQDKLTTLASYTEIIPYKNSSLTDVVSYSDEYSYEKTCPQVNYNISNNLFKEFLLKKVFKVYGEDNKEANYINGIDYVSDQISGYYELPKSFVNKNNYQYLAGTLLTSKINENNIYETRNLNMGILFEETYNNENEVSSKVKIELRDEEPLMQSIIDCNGKVYDFKKGVKLSEFSKFIEKNPNTPTGYIDYNAIESSNQSFNKSINESSNQISEDDFIKPDSLYTYKDLDSDSGNIENMILSFYSSYYVIYCSFFLDEYNNVSLNVQNDINQLFNYKPYITIIRVINKYNTINYNIINNNYINNYIIGSVFSSQIYSITNEGKNFNYYILNEMK